MGVAGDSSKLGGHRQQSPAEAAKTVQRDDCRAALPHATSRKSTGPDSNAFDFLR